MGNNTKQLSNLQFEKLSNSIVEWQSVFTGDGSTGLTAVSGRGYFIDTTSGTVTVTLPASPNLGDTIMISDYAGTFNTNNVTIDPNGGKIQNSTANGVLDDNNGNVSLVYIDSTRGWKQTNRDNTNAINSPKFVAATGGTETTSGDYKIHTFTGDGCFVVSCAGNPLGSAYVSYVVVAGGGAAAGDGTGGGGAGGYREGKCSSDPYTASPLATCGLAVSAQTYPITVGGGGAGVPQGTATGNPGSNSVFSTITSAGGGAGERNNGSDGGSGGGGGRSSCAQPGGNTGGAGNTPPVSPPQGNPGGNSPSPFQAGGGGGGATAAGGAAGPGGQGGNGGAGATSCITGSPVARAGGGGGGSTDPNPSGTGGSGGGGVGGSGTPSVEGDAGTANTGGGAGGSTGNTGPGTPGKAGGKGIVIIRYKYQ